MVDGFKVFLDYGNTGILLLVLFGVWRFGMSMLERQAAEAKESRAERAAIDREFVAALKAFGDRFAAHDVLDVERHGATLAHVDSHMRRSSEEHAEILGEVSIALAELRGQRRAEDEAAERPTPAGGVPHMGRSRG